MPFTYDNITTATEYLIDLQSDFGTILFKETQYTEFRCTYQNNVPEHGNIAKKRFLFSFKCPQRMYTKVVFLVCVRSNLKLKSNLSLYSLYYAEACNELAGPISASLRLGNTASCKEMSQQFDRPEI